MKQYICPTTDILSVKGTQLMSGSGSNPGWSKGGSGDAGDARVVERRLDVIYF